MEKKNIRLLREDEIECRPGMITEKGLSLLLYTQARAAMNILDETFGPMNWQRTHLTIADNLYCNLQIYDETKKMWISKMDVGTESYTERIKGKSSDSFKRAAVSVGVGRELYTAGHIWIPAFKTKIEKKDGKFITNDKFSVKEIKYGNKREIVGLVIINQDGTVVYCLKKDKPQEENVVNNGPQIQKESKDALSLDSQQIQAMNKELIRTGVALDSVLHRYGVKNLHLMDKDTYQKAMNGLKKTKSKAA